MSVSGNTRNPVLIAWLPAIAYMMLIWVMSSLSHVPSLEAVPFHDKGVHFLEYGTLAALLAHAFRGTRPLDRPFVTFLIAVASATFFGMTDEMHQAFVPGRNSDVHDLMADALGATVAAALYCFALLRLLRKS